jgi:ATP-dependent DNA helicase RecQ
MQTPIQLLKKFYGYDYFRPMQEEIIRQILEKKDVLVLMPTGGGKSVCFQIPALLLEGTCLVISPLIALMKDQIQGLRANGIPAACLNSSLSLAQERETISELEQNKLRLLYLSPEKAIQLSGSLLKSFKISAVAIDEAHCISQWGHDFRPEYARLKELRSLLPDIPFVALTATADKATRKDIINQLSLRNPETFVSSFDRPNLSLKVRSGIKEKDKLKEIGDFIRQRKKESGIIYCLSRNGTEGLASKLRQMGIACGYYHAGMSSEERSKTQEAFINDELPVICATIAFGMGIDKSNVRWVIHYNLPKNMEGYYQEIGRAGRDGLPSDTVLYYNLKDLIMLTKFARDSGLPELSLEKLKRIQQYAEARVCRRKILLSYFGESCTTDCSNCDTCTNPPDYIDGTVIAQKALSAIIRLGEKNGTTMIIHVLRGSQNGELLELGYHKIKTYGAGKDLSFDAWSHYMLQLIQLGVIEMAYDENFVLKVTAHGRQVLQGSASVPLVKPIVLKSEDLTMGAGLSRALSGSDGLFEQLRNLRKQIAESANMPPYLIFHDKTLRDMAEKLPRSMSQMLQVTGVSERKFEKYGSAFLDLIISVAGSAPKTTEEPVESLLQTEKMEQYLKKIEATGTSITPQLFAKILLGTSTKSFPEEITELSFFGLLQGRALLKEIMPAIKTHFEASQSALRMKPKDVADEYFAEPCFNRLDGSEKKNLTDRVASFEIQRPNDTIVNDYILEQRRTHKRAYEPWNDLETQLFNQTLKNCNDLDVLASIFHRSPASIKAFYKKMHSAVIIAGQH